jgi:beta-lactamase regulating signal transducer with metallopeptidase domain
MAFMLIPIGKILTALLGLCHNIITAVQPLTEYVGESALNVGDEAVFLTEIAVGNTPITFPSLPLPKMDIFASISPYLLTVWFVGMVVILAVKGYKVWQFKKRILHSNGINSDIDTETLELFQQCVKQAGLRQKITLKICSRVKTPLVMGIFKPIIIYPDVEMTEAEKKLAFTHELTHIKNRDLWFKFFAFCIPIIHWFNPLAYLLCRKLYAISEIHCDECIVKTMTRAERKVYGNLILKAVSEISMFQTAVCSPLSTKKRNIERRLLNMMNFKKSRRGILVLSVVVALVFTSLGTIYAFAANNDGGKLLNDADVIKAPSFKLDQPDSFPKIPEMNENGATLVSTDTDVCFGCTDHDHSREYISNVPADLEKIIADIESGKIKPTTEKDLLAMLDAGFKAERYELTVNGVTEAFAFNDGESAIKANCAHVYQPATFSIHGKYSDGSCRTEYYDAIVCLKCKTIWILAFNYAVTYRVCPH